MRVHIRSELAEKFVCSVEIARPLSRSIPSDDGMNVEKGKVDRCECSHWRRVSVLVAMRMHTAGLPCAPRLYVSADSSSVQADSNFDRNSLGILQCKVLAVSRSRAAGSNCAKSRCLLLADVADLYVYSVTSGRHLDI